MAKQAGPVFFTGTIDGIIFYKLGDKYYSRSKGSYKSAKHMRRNPRYKRTMQQADQFGTASKLVQEVYYRHLPKAVRKQGLFGSLTGLVNGWLQQGKKRKEVLELLIAHCASLSIANSPLPTVTNQPKKKTPQSTPLHTPPATTSKPHKQARYLSNWKVKRNGRLYIPKNQAAACWPPAIALAASHPKPIYPSAVEGKGIGTRKLPAISNDFYCHPELVSASDDGTISLSVIHNAPDSCHPEQ